MTLKILNLYAGIGGNRKLWNGDIEVTAIENNPKIAEVYKDFFPKDKVIVTDAHQYLLEHYKEFDFIWSSPPCPTHSRMCLFIPSQGKKDVYPSMKLYEEIILLKHFFKGKWVIENVISYYDPLIKPFKVGNHYYWSNFIIPDLEEKTRSIIRISSDETILDKSKRYNIDLSNFNLNKTLKVKMLNNCVEPKTGKYIFNCAYRTKQNTLFEKEAVNGGGFSSVKRENKQTDV